MEDDNWDPRRNDFTDASFNSYDQGPGLDLQHKHKADGLSTESVRLYVSGIPNALHEDALRNMFAKAGKVISTKKMVSNKPETGCTFGFIQFASMKDAENAIRKYDKFKIDRFNLSVKVAIPEETKRQRAMKQKEDIDFMNSIRSTRGRPGGFSDDDSSSKENNPRNRENENSADPQKNAVNGNGQSIHIKPKGGKGRGAILQELTKRRSLGSESGDEANLQQMSTATSASLNARFDSSTSIMPELEEMISSHQKQPENQYEVVDNSFQVDVVEDLKITCTVRGSNDSRSIKTSESKHVEIVKDIFDLSHKSFGRGAYQGPGSYYGPPRGQPNYYGPPRFQQPHWNQRYPQFGRGYYPEQQGFRSPGYGFNPYYNEPYYNQPAPPFRPPNRPLLELPEFGMQHRYNQYHDPRMEEPQSQFQDYDPYSRQFQKPKPQRFIDCEQSEDPIATVCKTEKPAKKKLASRPCILCEKLGNNQCSRCKSPYCSRECQQEDWSKHKTVCKMISDLGIASDSDGFTVNIEPHIFDKYKDSLTEVLMPEKKVARKPKATPATTTHQTGHMQPKDADEVSTATRASPAVRPKQEPSDQPLAKDLEAVQFPLGEMTKVNISHVVSIDEIWVYIVSASIIEEQTTLAMLNEHYEGSSEQSIIVKKGEMYATKYHEDGNWYRVCIKDILSSTKAKVFFIDYGNEDEINFSELRILMTDFQNVRKQAIRLGIADVTAAANRSNEATNMLKEIVIPYIDSISYTAEALRREDGITWVNMIIDGNSSIKQLLTKANVVNSEDPHNSHDLKRSPMVRDIGCVSSDLSVGQELLVMIMTKTSPLDIRMQIADAEKVKAFEEYNTGLHASMESGPQSQYRPIIGELVFGKFSEVWYRAEVIEVTDHQAKVLYIDFGNVEDVGFEHLRPANEASTTLPAQTFAGKLCGLGDVSPEVCSKFVELIGDSIVMTCIIKGLGNQIDVDLVDAQTGESISVKLKTFLQPKVTDSSSEKKPPVSTTRLMATDVQTLTLPLKRLLKVDIIQIDGFGKLFIQLKDNAKQLNEIRQCVNEFCATNNESYEPVVDEMVLTKYSMDGEWYRSRVLEIERDNVCIQFLDFGNKDITKVTDLRKPDPALFALPIQAVQCSLFKVSPSLDESDLGRFANIVKPGNISARTVAINENVHDVEILTDLGILVNNQFQTASSPRNAIASSPTNAITSSPTNATTKPLISPRGNQKILARSMEHATLPTGVSTKGKIVHIEDFSRFCVLLPTHHKELSSLMEKIKHFCADNHKVYLPVVGEMVLAQFTNDQQWYRALVEGIVSDTAYEVQFVDYGNKEFVDNKSMRRPDADFFVLPLQAVQCQLSGLIGQEDTKKLKDFKSLLDNLVFVTSKGCSNNFHDVEVVLETGKSVNAILQGKVSEPAAPTPSVSTDKAPIRNQQEAVLDKSVTKSPVAQRMAQSPDRLMADRVSGSTLPLGTNVQAFVRHREGQTVYVLLTSDIQPCMDLSMAIQEHCTVTNNVYKPIVGELVLAQFEGEWCRARVDEYIEGTSCTMCYIDYGNTSVLSCDLIRKPKPEFFNMPSFAIECDCAGLDAVDTTKEVTLRADCCVGTAYKVSVITSESSNTSKEIPVDDPVSKTVDIPSNAQNSITDLIANHEGGDASRLMFEQFSTSAMPLDTEVRGLVFAVASVQKLIIQLTNVAESLHASLLEINQFAEASATIYKPIVGEMVLAKSLDGVWYRANVLEYSSGGNCRVEYVDYGNMETISCDAIRKPNPEFFTLPFFGIHCRLAGVSPQTQIEESFINTYLLNYEVVLKAVRCVGNVYDVNIVTSDGKCVNQMLEPRPPSPGPAIPLVDLPPMVSMDNQVIWAQDLERTQPSTDGADNRIVITHVNNPGDFYCQLVDPDAFNLLTLVMQNMTLDCESSPLAARSFNLQMGQVCCAKYEGAEDNNWYRVSVLSILPTGDVLVHYLDFGNNDTVPRDRLRPIAAAYAELRILAFKCALADVQPLSSGREWSPASSMLLSEHERQSLPVTFVDRAEDTYRVHIVPANGVAISQALIEAELAERIPVPKAATEPVVESEVERLRKELARVMARLEKLEK